MGGVTHSARTPDQQGQSYRGVCPCVVKATGEWSPRAHVVVAWNHVSWQDPPLAIWRGSSVCSTRSLQTRKVTVRPPHMHTVTLMSSRTFAHVHMHLHSWRGSLRAHTCLFAATRATCAGHPRVEYASHQSEQTHVQALPHATTGCQREMHVCVI